MQLLLQQAANRIYQLLNACKHNNLVPCNFANLCRRVCVLLACDIKDFRRVCCPSHAAARFSNDSILLLNCQAWEEESASSAGALCSTAIIRI